MPTSVRVPSINDNPRARVPQIGGVYPNALIGTLSLTIAVGTPVTGSSQPLGIGGHRVIREISADHLSEP